ncbi:MAG: hypothetical protein FJ096_18600 [Deltaproteobacteria bacterium]|nr:hypothetical protein [Deltaproteobacteria bacterium]
MRSLIFVVASSVVLVAFVDACGARSSLRVGESRDDGEAGGGGAGGQGGSGGAGEAGAGGAGGAGGTGGEGGVGGAPLFCEPGSTRPCGMDVGACEPGVELCDGATWGECLGSIEPMAEACNGSDDDCDGDTDEGFGLGLACDGPDGDLCKDDVVACGGCTAGPTNVETCNGKDDNCNGTIDSDCDTGDCQPGLLVTGSMPSNPNCIDFPVEKGSTGVIKYPCGGGFVTAKLGSLQFSGTVKDGVVKLEAVGSYLGPDNCTWQTYHTIQGTLPNGVLTYSYSEGPIAGTNCWFPCTETGTVKVDW